MAPVPKTGRFLLTATAPTRLSLPAILVRALDVDNADGTVGTNIQIWDANGTIAQKWYLYTGQPLANGTYTISTTVNAQCCNRPR